MTEDTIKQRLKERFAVPLPEYYKRRIVFWQDEDCEFSSIVDDLQLDGVTIIKLTDSNNFAVKKLLSEDDLTNNYLVYNPIAYEKYEDNWLQDIELYSEEFRADFLSMQMEELHIAPSPNMRRVMRAYSKFFDNKDRCKALRQIGKEYDTQSDLQIDIMAVLCGLSSGTAQDVMIAVLSGGMEKEKNSALENIRKFGNLDAFWQMVQHYTGYINDDDKPLSIFASHVLLTALSQTMSAVNMKGLEQYISDTGRPFCYGLVHDWLRSENEPALYEVCRMVEQQFQLPTRFSKLDIKDLLSSECLPCINECILLKFFKEISEQIIKDDVIIDIVEKRRTMEWYKRVENYFDGLYYIAKMQQFYKEHMSGYHIVEPKNVWKLYTDEAYKMDTYYREFHLAFGNSLKNSNPALEDSFKVVAEYAEAHYQNFYLKQITAAWTNSVGEELSVRGYAPDIPQQQDFYSHYVQPILGSKNSRAFVIISDALRYEVAAELAEYLTRTTNGKATLESMQSVFPSITKFGMAALLPHKKLSVTSEIEVLADGCSTEGTENREKVLNAANKNSVAIRYKDLVAMKKPDLRSLFGKEVVYIYHNSIDAIGDKPDTESKVFEACESAIEEISTIVRIITNELSATNIFITADHGFLYTYSPLQENQKISKTEFDGTVYECGRRYAITAADTKSDYLLPVNMAPITDNEAIKGYAPQDIVRIKISGGGENYVHGGISLQEMVVPVVVFKNIRKESNQYVEIQNASLTLLSESRKISNLIFSLDFLQKEPVGGKIQASTYILYMADETGLPVSDKQTVIADKTSDNASDRVLRVRFNLKSMTFNKNSTYHLVIADADGTGIPEEIEFHIDIAFSDDYGFNI